VPEIPAETKRRGVGSAVAIRASRGTGGAQLERSWSASLRNTGKSTGVITEHRTVIQSMSTSVCGLKQWNILTDDIKESTNLVIFNKKLKDMTGEV